MAKARPIEGLSADDPFAAAAARIVDVRARELLDHAHGVLDTRDIEPLHDMRVASRRLRAALEIFRPCFPEKELKTVLREVKALADALGERRDRDVTIAALDDVAESMAAPDRPGIRTFTESLRFEQTQANKALARFVTPERLASLGEQVSELVASAEPAYTGRAGGNGELVQLPGAQRTSDNGAGRIAAEEET
jgi:CHAD domain-containing protein